MNARDFGFKNWYFPSSACCSYPCRIPCRIYYDLVTGMWHLKRGSVSSFNSTIQQPKEVVMDLVVKLQTMQQLIILATFLSNRKSIVIGI